jgi:hypothetical protein
MSNGGNGKGNGKKQNKRKRQPFEGKELELLIVSLILTNKLAVQDVTLSRAGDYQVSLKGNFNINKEPNKNVKDLARFIDEHPNLNLRDIMEVIKSRGKG